MDIYERARQNRGIAPELKTALRTTILRSINHSVGGVLDHALPELNERTKLDPITPKVVASTQKIALALSQGLQTPWYEVNKLKRYLGVLLPEDVPPSAGNTNSALPPTPAAASPIAQDVESSISKLSGESLRTYLQQTIEPNLSNPASEIYVDFRNALDRISIKALIALRPALASLDTVPAIFNQTVERRIQEELSTTLPQLAAVPLAELYERCVQVSAPQEDIRIVLNALRARLRLPPPSEEGVTHDVSIAGLLVWRSIFSDIPPDGALLSDIFRVHFSAIMTHIARSFSPHNTPGSALDATLRYGEELGILSSYVPNKRLHDVPLWKVIFFTALVRAQIGEKGGVVDTLTREITSRLTTTEAQAVDGFPPQWVQNAGSSRIADVCGDIAASILQSSPPPSFDELSLLLTNARLFERKGPSQINHLYEQLRQRFMYALRRIEPSELRGKDNHSLRRFTQALAAARYRSVALLEVISDECVRRADSFSTTEFNTVASALATVRGGSPEFWSKFAERVDQEWLSYGDEISTVPIWSLVVGDPEKVPSWFNSMSVLSTGSHMATERVQQCLIALGRYMPGPHDRTYKRLISNQTPHAQLKHEVDFMRELPSIIGVPAESIFSQVVIGGFETDYVVDFGHRRLIIELDGAGHYLCGPDGGILQGRDAFQDIVFRRLGYEVIHIPFDSRDKWYRNRNAIPQLKDLAESLKKEALDPGTERRVYRELLTSTEGK